MAASITQVFEHPAANAIGLLDERFPGAPLVQFRGIKYASIPERFAAPVLEDRDLSKLLRATAFGPRCPQLPVDVRDLMQIPKDLELYPPETEDEFECLNLNITVPAANKEKLPVLIWIYGGAQVVSFSSAAHRLCETGPFAAQAILAGQPVVLVNPHYRLNLLAYGDGEPTTEKNLNIQDLQAAVTWTINNISAFGGDPSRITVAGESAGAILTHALCMTLPPTVSIRGAILCSGSYGTSPFQPPSFFESTLRRVVDTARGLATAQSLPNADELTLRTLPVPLLVASMAANAVSSIPLQTPANISDLPSPTSALSCLSALMVGDCDFEGILWLQGIRMLSDDAIRSCFTESSSSSSLGSSPSSSSAAADTRLASAYLPESSSSSTTTSPTNTMGLTPTQSSALTFMADHLFHSPNHTIITSLLTNPQTKLYTYIFSQPNPFASTTPTTPPSLPPTAHHGVDLLALWNTYTTDYPPTTNGTNFATVSESFRSRIIAFVNGSEPWPATTSSNNASSEAAAANPYAYAFGPDGAHGTIPLQEYRERRNVAALEVMEEVGKGVVDGVWTKLIGAVSGEVKKAMMAMAAAAAAAEKGGEEAKL